MTTRYDAIVIGAGQAGPSLVGRLTGAGLKVAAVERKNFGGTCVNNGCIPTKAMVASARAIHMAGRGDEYGVVVGGPITMDMKKVKARKDAIVGKSRNGLESWLKSMTNCTVYEGHGSFEGPHTVRVGAELIEADKIFINVGARASVPRVEGLNRLDYLNNSSIMDIDFLPEHLIILGGGYIALEFGQMYHRFGSEVTLIQRGPRILGREDEDISTAIRGILEKEGVSICTQTGEYRVENHGGKVVMNMNCNGEPAEIVGTHLLVATGRVPNTQDLALHKAGIRVDSKGFIEVDDELRTEVEGIWALGECNGRGAFTHTSYNDFEIVAANLLDNESRRVTDRIPAYALYIDPPLGRAGMTEAQVRKAGRGALVATRPMSRVSRAVEKGETQGFMKVLVDAGNSHILGAAILGVGGDEVVHSILDVMYARAPYTVIQRAVHIHPTVTELIPTLLAGLKPLEDQ